LNQNPFATLAKAIRAVAVGETWVDPEIIRAMAEAGLDRESTDSVFTERQQEVLRGIMDGLTNKEIASQLGASESAVKATLQGLFHKNRVRSRCQLVRVALEMR
jgi:DNA-binding NarL/FixJ family response regulator